jgi:hypothetical protein
MADKRQQRRNRHLRGADAAVADDQDVLATLDRIDRFGAQRGQLGLHTFVAPIQRVGDVQRVAAELALGVRSMSRSLAMSAKSRIGWLTSIRIGGLTWLMSSRLGLGR